MKETASLKVRAIPEASVTQLNGRYQNEQDSGAGSQWAPLNVRYRADCAKLKPRLAAPLATALAPSIAAKLQALLQINAEERGFLCVSK